MAESSKNIIVVGASYAGIPLAHHLLKILPAEYKLILVNPSTHFYYNMASPRALVSPTALSGSPTSALFTPIAPGFSAFLDGRFNFIQGHATSLDAANNLLVVKTITDAYTTGGAELSIPFLHVVVATGAGAVNNFPFKPTETGTYADTLASLEAIQEKVGKAASVIVAGAGTTGVETAGEIATDFPDKKVTLISSDAHVLHMIREDVGKAAEQLLEKLHVEIVRNAKVVSETANEKGGVEVVLSTGETLTADYFIPTYGIVPNTTWLPKELLDASGWLIVDNYLRTPTHKNVWALGDVTNQGNRKGTTIDDQLFVLAQNLVAGVKAGTTEDVAGLKEYQHNDGMKFLVPVGRKFASGTGLLGSWKVWGLLVWLFKGRSFGIDKSAGIVQGKGTVMGTKV